MDRKFGRKKANREHMMRNLVTSLILYERITTTEPKAKELKKAFDRLMTIAKKDDLTAHRQILGYVFDTNAAKKIKEVLVPRFTSRTSGFTKSYRAGIRLGDAAPMMIVELIPDEKKPKAEVKAPKAKVEKAEKVAAAKSE